MTLMLICAAPAALGLVGLYRLAVPAPPQLRSQVSRWDEARARAGRRAELDAVTETARSPLERLAGWLADQIRVRQRQAGGLETFERDLAITGSTLEQWLTKTLGVVLAGLLVPVGLLAVLPAAGLEIPLTWAPAVSLVLAGLMALLSVRDLRTAAGKEREDFRRALSIYLDLVVMSMEAGRGHAEALPAAAGIGTGRVFTELRDAIDLAHTFGHTPWEALGRLGDRYGVVELIDLRNTLALAQDEGGRVRSTLIARAETMREARLTATEGRAEVSTEAMKHTVMLMAILGATYVMVARLLFLVGAG